MRLKAAVIGLGRIGSRFDEEPGRSLVWSHVGAYLAHRHSIDVIAGCDPDPDCRSRFRARCPDSAVFEDPAEMLNATAPDVVSICTPAPSHAAVLSLVLSRPSMRAVWCEKPLADTLEAARGMVEQAEARAVPLLVSHVRRWSPLWIEARHLAETGAVGPLRCVRIAMPNRLLSIGSHAIDLALLLGGRATGVRGLHVPSLDEDGEPAVAAMLTMTEASYGIVQVTGLKRNLCVEAEVLGDDGRFTVHEGRGEIVLERFASSPKYTGYRELAGREVIRREGLAQVSPFVAIADDVAGLAMGTLKRARCSGRNALEVQEVMFRLQGELQ